MTKRKFFIDTDTASESESLNTNVGATEGERERSRERDREVQDITSLVFEPDQESNGDDHVVERKTSQSPKRRWSPEVNSEIRKNVHTIPYSTKAGHHDDDVHGDLIMMTMMMRIMTMINSTVPCLAHP